LSEAEAEIIALWTAVKTLPEAGLVIETVGDVWSCGMVFAAGQLTGDLVGEGCGSVNVTEQNSEVNGVKNVQGNVSANCSGGGHAVVAAVNFENCH
jgi:hypothetical protein